MIEAKDIAAGRATDKLVSEKFFGMSDADPWRTYDLLYSTEVDHAFKIAEKLISDGYYVSLDALPGRDGKPHLWNAYAVIASGPIGDKDRYDVWAETLPLALTRLALVFAGYAVEGSFDELLA